MKFFPERLFVGDFVISATQELDQADAVAERISQVRDAAPAVRLDVILANGAGFPCSGDCRLNGGNDKVNMHWRPMTGIAP